MFIIILIIMIITMSIKNERWNELRWYHHILIFLKKGILFSQNINFRTSVEGIGRVTYSWNRLWIMALSKKASCFAISWNLVCCCIVNWNVEMLMLIMEYSRSGKTRRLPFLTAICQMDNKIRQLELIANIWF